MKYAVVAALTALLISCSAKREPLPSYGAVPDFQLTAQDGQAFDSKTLNGKVWVADFFFTTCPGPCPRMTSQMHEVQQSVAKNRDVKLVSFTIDPWHDTPPVLADYAKIHGASPGRWYFLTGPQPTLQMLDKEAFKLGDVDGKLMHSTRFVLVDRQAQIRGYYDTSEPDSISRLVSDIESLTRERG
jgi:protein SCO1/2